MFALDLVAIAVLAFAIYFPRHRRKDLVVAFLGVNVGVLAVTSALTSAPVGAGLGLGLFGVLSIIRLRSSELNQEEVAYYLASLSLGLIGGITITPAWLSAALMVATLLALYVGDHPRILGGYRVHELTLDTAYTDEAALTQQLELMLGARVHRIVVRRVDLVNDSTCVEVRFQVLPGGGGQPSRGEPTDAQRGTS